MANDFILKTEVFEGPLDLLLSLIEKKKLFINDLSLSKVTEEYLSYIKLLPEYSLSDRAEFIVIASTLLLIKARSLLPTIALTDEEQGSIEDLEMRLKELEIMRRASIGIKNNFGKFIIFPRGGFDGDFIKDVKVFAPSKDLSATSLAEAISRVVQALPKAAVLPKVAVKRVMSLEEVIGRLSDRIQSALSMSFREFSQTLKKDLEKDFPTDSKDETVAIQRFRHEKVHVIVSFLAMLELVKQGMLSVKQDNMFDEIEMERHDVGIPSYQ